MSKKFVRNITNTKLKGDNKEPLYTNIQNDILSDDEDVYVRNQKEYHCLTDNIKEVKTTNDVIEVEKTGKNEVTLTGKKTEIESLNNTMNVVELETNKFTLENKIASKEVAETGVNNEQLMTPLRTHEAITKNIDDIELYSLNTDYLEIEKIDTGNYNFKPRAVYVMTEDAYITVHEQVNEENKQVIFRVSIDLPELYDMIVTQLKNDGYITDDGEEGGEVE